ncbi:MAG: GNAT family N-acetyltransferase [Clostridia bacterium]|nr:GNAT family N-acetyltransferase [Clostridia bacterium]
MEIQIVSLLENPQLIERAAAWFHPKFGVPTEAYLESMQEALHAAVLPRWYVAMDGERICGGLGLIANDFHPFPELCPNVCAMYVDEDYRCRGIAGTLLHRVCADAALAGADTLYLFTNHTGFYERYGWRYLKTVSFDGETSRVYVHTAESK